LHWIVDMIIITLLLLDILAFLIQFMVITNYIDHSMVLLDNVIIGSSLIFSSSNSIKALLFNFIIIIISCSLQLMLLYSILVTIFILMLYVSLLLLILVGSSLMHNQLIAENLSPWNNGIMINQFNECSNNNFSFISFINIGYNWIIPSYSI
jgi:hypothetical protein